MKVRGRLMCLAGIACLGLALPAGASATPGHFVSRPFQYAQVHVRGSHGYWLRIDGFTTNVNVTARKGDSSVEYDAGRGRLRKDAIRARLPGVGWVFLRFHEQTRHRLDPPDNCNGPGTLVRRGYYTGWIRIRGERDYTSVDARRAVGKISVDSREVCRARPGARTSGSSKEELVLATVPRGKGQLSFEADEWAPFAGLNALFFDARLYRERGAMTIVNSVSGLSEDPGKMAVADPPRSATVDPPPPFTGSATFTQEGPKDFTWLGDLGAELPGIGPVSLAGPGFTAILCLGRSCRGDAEKPIGSYPLYGSGSHSQPLALARLSSLR